MGIKSINQFLKDKQVQCFVEKYPLSNFSNHRIAIDAANWCYMFIAGEHKDNVFKTKNIIDNDVDRNVTLQRMYNKFLQFNIMLLQNRIIPVWCWDGIAHEEKGPEREKRRKARKDREEKAKELKAKIEAVPSWLRNAKNLGMVPPEMIEQAKQFTAATEVNALALTKLDGTAKGGVVIGVADQFKIPVKYIGVGEGIEDLQLFDKVEFVDSLFKG
jgi:hypothetical protein